MNDGDYEAASTCSASTNTLRRFGPPRPDRPDGRVHRLPAGSVRAGIERCHALRYRQGRLREPRADLVAAGPAARARRSPGTALPTNDGGGPAPGQPRAGPRAADPGRLDLQRADADGRRGPPEAVDLLSPSTLRSAELAPAQPRVARLLTGDLVGRSRPWTPLVPCWPPSTCEPGRRRAAPCRGADRSRPCSRGDRLAERAATAYGDHGWHLPGRVRAHSLRHPAADEPARGTRRRETRSPPVPCRGK